MPQSCLTQHFNRATSEEAREQASRGFETIRQDAAMARAENELQTLAKADRTRELNAERQRKHRKRKSMAEISAGIRDPVSNRPVKVSMSTIFICLLC